MSKHIRILTFNIQSGLGIDNKRSLPRIAWVIKCSGADLIGLQETDKYMKRSDFSFQARKLANLLGMHYVFGGAWKPSVFSRFGNAILSKYPIIGYKNTLLPGKGEQRAMLEAVVCKNKRRIRFCNTHLGLSVGAREEQVGKIIELLGDLSLPTILTGDFNTMPDDPIINKLAACFGQNYGTAIENTIKEIKTYPSDNPTEKIDYIFFSSHWEEISQKTLAGQASDHLPLLGEARLAGEDTV